MYVLPAPIPERGHFFFSPIDALFPETLFGAWSAGAIRIDKEPGRVD
jgi:hypothetical protein